MSLHLYCMWQGFVCFSFFSIVYFALLICLFAFILYVYFIYLFIYFILFFLFYLFIYFFLLFSYWAFGPCGMYDKIGSSSLPCWVLFLLV